MRIKIKQLILFLIILLGLFLRVYHLDYPYLDHNSWRQTDVASFAENFYNHDFNILKPEVNWNGKENSILGLEFQITPWLTSILYLFLGIKDWVGRIIPIIFSLLSLIYIYKLIELYHNFKVALFSTFVFAILPLNVFFSRVLMPESGMIFFSIASLYYTSKYIKNEKQKEFILAIFFITLTFLSKLPTLYLLLPLAFIIYSKYGFKFINNRKIWILFLLPIFITILYYVYIQNTADITHISYKLGTKQWGNLQVWKDSNFYSILILRFYTIIFTSLGSILFIAGLFLSKRKYFFHIWLFSIIAYFFILAHGNKVTSYYQLPIIPVGSYFIGLALYTIYKTRRLKIFSYITCLLLFYLSMVNLLPLYDMYAYSVYPAASKIQEIDKENALILFIPHRVEMKPELSYYANRKGWVINYWEEVSNKLIEEYKEKGVKYVIMTEPTYLTQKTKENLQKEGAYVTDHFIILNIDHISLKQEEYIWDRGDLLQKGYDWMGEGGITLDLTGVILRK